MTDDNQQTNNPSDPRTGKFDPSAQPAPPASNEQMGQTEPTPNAAEPNPQPQNAPRYEISRPSFRQGQSRTTISIVSAVVLIIIVVAAFAFLYGGGKNAPTTTSAVTLNTSTTTIKSVIQNKLSGCATITSPGQYYLSSDIYTSKPESCISVKSSNVELIGQGHLVHGAGPYVAIPPFTYGVTVSGASNVSISGLRIANFSFGIFVNNSANVNVSGDNASADVVSGIYLVNSYHNKVSGNLVSFIRGSQGALFLNSSDFNNVTNNLVKTNANIGVFLNGTNNQFSNNTFTNNPVDLTCSPASGVSKTNVFRSTTCSTNLYCDFAQCSFNNVPVNLSSIHLPLGITSCGGIYAPGNYSLENNLYATSYINTSQAQAAQQSCITVLAPDVNLNCRGHQISNAGTGISVESVFSNITNCVIYNNTYGISSTQQINLQVHNTSISKGQYGLYLNQITSGTIANVITNREQYGAYISNSTGIIFNSLNSTNNTYGAYVLDNPENAFQDSNLLGNSNEDLFCDLNTYSSSVPIFQNNVCGVTDCKWAASSCAKLVPPPLANVPISTCGAITSAGNYTITANMAQINTCISIQASNVNLDCNGHFVGGGHSGNGIQISGQSNVSVRSCNLAKFFTGINITNSTNIRISNVIEPASNQGLSVLRSSNINISNVTVPNFTGSYGLLLLGSSGSRIRNVTVTGGSSGSSGFILNKSTNNTLKFNTAALSNGYYGFKFVNSTNNIISNNTSYNARAHDFYCSGSSSGIYSENGNGVNSGNTKYNCPWMIETNIFSPGQCFQIGKSSTVMLAGDFVYPYGESCYNINPSVQGSANNTVINCNHHTILATHGGTFVTVTNSTNIVIENCYLKNFTNAIIESGGTLTLNGNTENNTIANSVNAITASNLFNFNIHNNTILNATGYAILYKEGRYGSISRNNVSQAKSCIYVVNGMGDNINTNICNTGGTGITFVNNTQSKSNNNIISNLTGGSFVCGANSNTSSSFSQDLGGNVCSTSNNCLWMTNSPQCVPS